MTVCSAAAATYGKKQFVDPKTPCCANCKKANRTRTFCREVHGHRDLPWTTVYVVLRATEKGGKLHDNSGGEKEKETGSDDGDDIHNIAPSRTFLSMVSTKQNSIQWLEQGTVNRKVFDPMTEGSFSPKTNVAAMAMQQQLSATRQANYNQYHMNQMQMQDQTIKETQTPKTDKKRQIKAHKGADHNAAPENQQKNRSKEAKAAIANANLQSRAEVNAQFTRQQFCNSQLYVQRMMQMQVWQMQQARQMEHQQHQQQEDVEKQSQPPKKRGRTKGGPKEEDVKSSTSVDGSIVYDDAKEAEKLPLAENPEEDGELLDWFDSLFDVK